MLNEVDVFSGFSVNDLRTAKEFYHNILGLTVDETQQGLILRLATGAHIFIYEKHNHVPAEYTILNFAVRNIDAIVEQLVSKGIIFETYDGITDQQGIARGLSRNQGPDIAWFKDPAGNIISVLQEA
jgi:predicted enzyme related to lactoylglutathione lyase